MPEHTAMPLKGFVLISTACGICDPEKKKKSLLGKNEKLSIFVFKNILKIELPCS